MGDFAYPDRRPSELTAFCRQRPCVRFSKARAADGQQGGGGFEAPGEGGRAGLKRPRDFAGDQSGALAVTGALFLVVLLAIAALAIDFGHMAWVQNELQKAAEAGALAGAQALGSSANPDWSQGQSTATYVVQQNSADAQPLSDCQVQYGYWSLLTRTLQPYTITPQSTDVPAIQVVVAKGVDKKSGAIHNGGPLQMLFAPIFGVHSMDLNAGAVAMLKPNATWSILETGNGSVTLSNNASTNRDVGDAGDGPFTMKNNATVQGKVYLEQDTVKSIGNNAKAKGGVEQDGDSQATLAQAVHDAQTAYTQLTGLAATLGTQQIDLKNNGTLTLNGSAAVNVLDASTLNLGNNSTLTLNGSASMSFVVRVAGGFSLSNNSAVQLTGGLKQDNVTFVMEGTSGVTLSNNAIMYASILSPNAAIAVSNNAVVYGALVSGQNISLNNNSLVTPPQTFIPSSGHGTALVK
jgi:Flp pilus assembly protein TadG